MCELQRFLPLFQYSVKLCIFIFILLYPHLPLSDSFFNFLRDVLLVFSFILYILLLCMYIYTFMQVIRIIHGHSSTILSIINLMKSKGHRFASQCISLDSPPNLHTSFPHLSSTIPKTCVGQLLCFHAIPNTPPVLLLGICHNMKIISHYPSPAQFPMNSAPLSCCHFHGTLPLPYSYPSF